MCNRDEASTLRDRRGEHPEPGDGVQRSSARKRRDDLEGLFEFLGEHFSMVAIGQPPGFFACDVLLGSSVKLT